MFLNFKKSLWLPPYKKTFWTFSSLPTPTSTIFTTSFRTVYSVGDFKCFVLPAAAAAAKLLQSCPILCDPIDGSPPGSPRPWDSPGKNTGVGCHFLLQCMKVKSESEVAQSDSATPWTAAYQAPLSMGFSRQEYWSGMPLPSPRYTIHKYN